MGEAAVGHSAEGTVVRLGLPTACFELETRMATSGFELYPEGTIRKFTQEARAAFAQRLEEVLHLVRLADRPDIILFPCERPVPSPR